MNQHDACGGFVDVLASVPARPYKALFQVTFGYTQLSHAPGQLVLFFGVYWKSAHTRSVNSGRPVCKRRVLVFDFSTQFRFALSSLYFPSSVSG